MHGQQNIKKAYYREGLVYVVVTKYGQTNRCCRILKKKKSYIKNVVLKHGNKFIVTSMTVMEVLPERCLSR